MPCAPVPWNMICPALLQANALCRVITRTTSPPPVATSPPPRPASIAKRTSLYPCPLPSLLTALPLLRLHSNSSRRVPRPSGVGTKQLKEYLSSRGTWGPWPSGGIIEPEPFPKKDLCINVAMIGSVLLVPWRTLSRLLREVMRYRGWSMCSPTKIFLC